MAFLIDSSIGWYQKWMGVQRSTWLRRMWWSLTNSRHHVVQPEDDPRPPPTEHDTAEVMRRVALVLCRHMNAENNRELVAVSKFLRLHDQKWTTGSSTEGTVDSTGAVVAISLNRLIDFDEHDHQAFEEQPLDDTPKPAGRRKRRDTAQGLLDATTDVLFPHAKKPRR